MSLRRFLLGTALSRLCGSPSYSLVSVFLLGIAGSLVAFAGGWLYVAGLRAPPYRGPDELYFVQVSDRFTATLGYGDELQASTRVVERLFLDRALLGPMLIGERRTVDLAPSAGASEKPQESVGLMAVSDDFWNVLGAAPGYGVAARADSGEVVIGHALSRALFGSPQRALGHVLQWDRNVARIVGVMGEDFVAPLHIASQRKAGGRVDVYLPVPWGRSDPGKDTASESRAAEMAVVIRHAGRPDDLRAVLATRMHELDDEFGRPGLTVSVKPLVAHMRGGEARVAIWLMLAAALLATTALSGVALLSSGRFASRAEDLLVLRTIGVRSGDEWMFERYEAWALIVIAVVAGLSLLAAGLLLFGLADVVRGNMPRGLPAAALGVFFVYALIAGGMMRWVAVWNSRKAAAISGAVRNARGAAKGALRGVWLRLLQLGQTVLALVLATWVLGLLGDAFQAFDAASQARFADIVQWRLYYAPGAAPQDIAEHVGNISRRLLSLPGVDRVAVGLVPALDLQGVELVGYRGPYATASEIVSGGAGNFIARSKRPAPRGTPAQVSYQLSLAIVEPAYLSMLGYRLAEGRMFSADEENVALLTPESAQAIFGRLERVSGELVPGAARTGPEDIWHNWLRIAGVVEAGRLTSVTATKFRIAQVPVAFLPYRQPPALPAHRSRSVYVLIHHRPGGRVSAAQLDGVLGADDGLLVRTQTQVLSREARRRLIGHLVASLGTVLLRIGVLASAALGTLGIVGMLLAARRAEVGVRLAVGGDESRIARWLARRELTSPCFAVLAWWGLMALGEAVSALAGVSLPFTLWNGLIAGVSVLAALAAGFLLALRGLFAHSPMEALRSE